MHSISRNSGVYIICNTVNDKIYIGQTVNLYKRWSEHKSDLKRNRHKNPHLQNAWNKYGAKAFQFKVLEYCSVDQLDSREDHFLGIYIPKGVCYNVGLIAGAAQRGRPLSADHRRKISEASIGKPKSAEHRRNIGNANKRRPPKSEETRRKLSEAGKGKSPVNKGKFASEETRAKMSAAHKGKQMPPQAIEAAIKVHKSVPLSEEHRMKISEAVKQFHARKKLEKE